MKLFVSLLALFVLLAALDCEAFHRRLHDPDTLNIHVVHHVEVSNPPQHEGAMSIKQSRSNYMNKDKEATNTNNGGISSSNVTSNGGGPSGINIAPSTNVQSKEDSKKSY